MLTRGEIFRCGDSVISSVVEGASVELIRAAFGHDVDDGARRLAIFRAIAVAQHLELSNRFDRRVNQDGTVRTDVVVVRAVYQEQVVRGRVAVDRKIDAALQPLVLAVKVVRARDPGARLRQLNKAAPVQGQFAHLSAVDDFA